MALTIAPVPLPGECVFSLASRFSAKWFASTRSGGGILFDHNAPPADPQLPRHLGLLAERLPAAARMTAEGIAMGHTSLPLFLPFITEPKAAIAIAAACNAGHLPFILGTGPSRVKGPKRMRLCRTCFAQDVKQYGLPYWHREHHLPGMLLCPRCEHETTLSITKLDPYRVFGSQRLGVPDLSEVLHDETIEAIWRPHLVGIGRSLLWLLENDAPRPGPYRLHAFYIQELAKHELLRPDGSVRLRRLVDAFEQHFGNNLLERLNCSVRESGRQGWLPRLVRRPRNQQHPLQHVLLMRFLGISCNEALVAACGVAPCGEKPGRKPHVNRIRSATCLNRLLPKKQTRWLELIKSEPSGSLRKQQPALYAWLWRNCPDWLASHRPKNVSPARPVSAKWLERDRELAALLPKIAAELTATRSPFTRASRNAIASRSGVPSWLVYDHPRLPNAIRAMKDCAETAEQYALRRVRLVAKLSGHPIKFWELRVRSGLSVAVASLPAVASEIAALSAQSTTKQTS